MKTINPKVNREFFHQSWSDSDPLDPCAARQVEHVTFSHNAVSMRKMGTETRGHHSRVYGSHHYVKDYKHPQDLTHLNC